MLALFLLALVTGSLVYCLLTIVAALRYRAVRPLELPDRVPAGSTLPTVRYCILRLDRL